MRGFRTIRRLNHAGSCLQHAIVYGYKMAGRGPVDIRTLGLNMSLYRWDRVVAASTMVFFSALTAGCSSSSPALSPSAEAPQSPSQQSFGDRFSQILMGTSTPGTTAVATTPQPDQPDYCPIVDVRQGASTMSVAGKPPATGGSDNGAMQIRYQGSLGQTARECSFVGGNLVVKVGVQGRIVLGPEGGAGQLEIPLRYALIQEGPEPKTIWTKLYRFPVAIGEGQASVPFSHVEEDMIVPRPKAADLESYVVYIGFDTLAMKPPTAKPTKPAKKR